MNLILDAREKRSQDIISKWRGNPLLIIKTNVPGPDKNPFWSKFLLLHFYNLISSKFSIIRASFEESIDGDYWLIELKEEEALKSKLIVIEEEHPLGRLIDLDLYLNPKKSISRSEMGLRKRKCLLCDQDALICNRMQVHSLSELLNKQEEVICNYLKKLIIPLIDEAITLEADLDPKFGLVTSLSNGSHPDMDYQLLMKSKEVILEPLAEIFIIAYRQGEKAYQEAIELGIEAEQRMFKATKKVNTYKGLIFVLGNTLFAFGLCLRENKKDLFQKIGALGKSRYEELNAKKLSSFGLYAYHQYGISGVRGEIALGLPNLQEVLATINDFSKETLLMTLIRLIERVDDTVLLKRAGSLEKYNFYRQKIGQIKSYNEKQIKELTDECIEEGLSFGGSADLLITAIFIKKVEGCFKFEFEREFTNRSI